MLYHREDQFCLAKHSSLEFRIQICYGESLALALNKHRHIENFCVRNTIQDFASARSARRKVKII